MTVVVACCGSDGPTSPTRTLSQTETTTHYVFHRTESDRVDSSRQEAFHDWAVPQLGVTPTRAIQYYKYLDRSHINEITGRETNGFAEPSAFTLHSIWPFDAHEVVHVLTAMLGTPSDLFNEGIAVALSLDPLAGRFVPLWNNAPVHDVARQILASGSTLRPVAILTSDRFVQQSNLTTYPMAGSFVGFLIERYSQDTMNQFFRSPSGRNASDAQIRQRTLNVWGKSLETLQEEWLAFLQN